MKSMEQQWSEIEQKHKGRCMWSQWVLPNKTILVECMMYEGISSPLIVTKHYSHGSKTRKLEAVYVHADIGGMTWESVDAALTRLSGKNVEVQS